MTQLPFKNAQVRKQGNSYVVTVPMHYITNGLLVEGEFVHGFFEKEDAYE